MLKRGFLFCWFFMLVSWAQAAPAVMHLDPRALLPQRAPQQMQLMPMSLAASDTVKVDFSTPLTFRPLLSSTGNVIIRELPDNNINSAQFTIEGPANTTLNARLSQSTPFELNGKAASTYPRITRLYFNGNATATTNNFSFKTDASGHYNLHVGGILYKLSTNGAQLYQAPASLQVIITNPSNKQSVQVPLQIHFAVIPSGHIETLRGLMFEPVDSQNTAQIHTVNPEDIQAAQFGYSPTNATFSIQTATVCLARSGTTVTSCPCNTSGAAYVRVSLNNSRIKSGVNCSGGTCRLLVGGTACFPPKVQAGHYVGTGTLRMTYS